MIATTAVVFLLSLAAFAFVEARTDARDIAQNLPIYHGISLMRRIVVCGAMLIIACIIWQLAYLYHDVDSRWSCLLLAPMGWAAWNIMFRLSLNKGRGLDWRYLSPSSRYDWQFIRHTLGWINRHDYRSRVNSVHAIAMNDPATTEYPVRIYRAGLLAYCFEVLVLVASIAALVAVS